MRNKKVIVLTMCACLGAITSLAQPREGTFSIVPHIGVSLANMGNNSIHYSVDSNNQRAYDSRYKAGFDGGVDFFYQAGQRQAVSLGVEYQMMGYRYPDLEQVDADEIHIGWSEQRLTSGYLAVPLKAHYYLVKGLSVNAGVQVGFLLHAKYHQVESNFYYDKNTRPHAVAEVENADGSIPGDALNTSFNDFGKIQLIEDVGKGLRMDFGYGPDRQRWYSELLSNGKVSRTTVYAGEYEKTTENGITREFYYLDGNTIVVRQNGITGYYLAFTDNLGSILSVMDENGRKVFDASYDAWGRQTVTLNTIGLHRGYTGHEMLSEFDIINMNGRLYDPVLGRFLSPDNYVQAPESSQSFNRYSYCMNNPLKYVDPSGHFAWFIPVIAGAIVGAYAGASIQSGTAAFWKWKSDAWKGAIAGGIVGATVGYGVASALASSGAVSGLTTIGVDGEIVAKSAGITSSVMNSGSINIAFNAITGGGWDGAWKSGLVGLATGAWSITGGFGMMKEVEGQSKFWQLANRLGYQMAGTVGQSVGNNWAAGKGLFSKVTLGVGPLNLTLGKGQRLLQWENNLGNIAINAFGLVNTIAGGKVRFNTDNLTFEYRGGLMDIFQPYPAYSAGFSPHTVTGNSGLSRVLRHELHHLWHSRALNDMYLLNYGLQGLNALILKGNFVAGKNYYEDFVDNFGWWNTKPQG